MGGDGYFIGILNGLIRRCFRVYLQEDTCFHHNVMEERLGSVNFEWRPLQKQAFGASCMQIWINRFFHDSPALRAFMNKEHRTEIITSVPVDGKRARKEIFL